MFLMDPSNSVRNPTSNIINKIEKNPPLLELDKFSNKIYVFYQEKDIVI
jgi:hypothetical protein